MVWVGLLILMLVVSAAPGVSIYLEHLRSGANEGAETLSDGQKQTA